MKKLLFALSALAATASLYAVDITAATDSENPLTLTTSDIVFTTTRSALELQLSVRIITCSSLHQVKLIS